MPLSIRAVLSFAIALVTIIAAIIAFTPTYLAGVTGIRSAVSDLRTANLARTQNLTQGFFEAPSRIVSGAADLTTAGVLDWTLTNPANKAKWYQYIWALMTNNAKVVRSVTVTQPLNPNPAWHEIFFLYGDGRWAAEGYPNLAVEPNATAGYDLLQAGVAPVWFFNNGIVYYYPYPNQTIIPLDPIFANTMANWRDIQQFALNTTVMTRWVPVQIGYATAQFRVLGFMRNSVGTMVGTLSILLDADTIGELLASLGLRRRSRAFCVDVASEIVVGMSWNESLSVRTAVFRNFNIPGWMRVKIKTLTNVTDALVTEAIQTVGIPTLLQAATPLYLTVKTAQGPTYVDVVSVTGPGLNCRVVVVIPEVDFLEQIQTTQAKTIGGVAGAIVFLIIITFILGHVVTAPFIRLRDRMYMTATLQDDGTVDPPSLLAEVSEMQASYELMRGELAKVKSYLPQSVLVTLYGNGDGNEEDEDEDDEGNPETLDAGAFKSAEGSKRSGAGTGTPKGSAADAAGRNASGSKYRGSVAVGDQPRSESDRHSSRSSARSTGAVAVAKGLNTATNLTAKRVTVAAFNLRGFHEFCGRSSVAEIAGGHSTALESISRHIMDNKGVVDFFHGDRLQASFNAVSHCAGHMKRGAMAALQVVKEFSKNSTMLHATVGLSTGPAHVGNIGTASMKRFCVIGPLVTQAALLERMTRLFPGVSILCPSSMFQDLSLELLLQSVAIVRLPGAGAKERVIASVEGTKKMATDEWMYQLKEGESGDPFIHINKFFELVAARETAQALEVYGQVATTIRETPLPGEAEAMRIAELLRQNASPCVQDFGMYFDKCVAPSGTS